MRIGLTYTGTDWKHENYVRWLRADEDIEVVRLEAGSEGGGVDGCDALVLSGGVDIHPELYGGPLDYPEKGEWKKERDLFEIAALRTAWERGLPVLGVCRGLQLINTVLKGTLMQDLGVAGDKVHTAEAGVDKQHPVTVEEGTLLQEIAGRMDGVVNSAHHQGIERLGEGLTVNCRAADGTIEGLEWADAAGRSFLLAVQWHPERMFVQGFRDVYLYRAIRDRFIKEIKKNQG